MLRRYSISTKNLIKENKSTSHNRLDCQNQGDDLVLHGGLLAAVEGVDGCVEADLELNNDNS